MMDTSEVYIKMCDHEKVRGDTLPLLTAQEAASEKPIFRGNNISVAIEMNTTDGRIVRLLRQDQIQEMMGYAKSMINTYATIGIFEDICAFGRNIWQTEEDFKTPEQLWLAFYMYEKQGLEWSAEGKWTKKR